LEFTQIIAKELGIKTTQVKEAVNLLDGGNTIPFIARYRKEAPEELDENVLRDIVERLDYLRRLDQRKTEVVRLIDEQGKLTEELSAQIIAATVLRTSKTSTGLINKNAAPGQLLPKRRV
jgi:uncharacterized protein